jgi:hypothetical protein
MKGEKLIKSESGNCAVIENCLGRDGKKKKILAILDILFYFRLLFIHYTGVPTKVSRRIYLSLPGGYL